MWLQAALLAGTRMNHLRFRLRCRECFVPSKDVAFWPRPHGGSRHVVTTSDRIGVPLSVLTAVLHTCPLLRCAASSEWTVHELCMPGWQWHCVSIIGVSWHVPELGV